MGRYNPLIVGDLVVENPVVQGGNFVFLYRKRFQPMTFALCCNIYKNKMSFSMHVIYLCI